MQITNIIGTDVRLQTEYREMETKPEIVGVTVALATAREGPSGNIVVKLLIICNRVQRLSSIKST